MKFSAVADIERRGYFYLCGFALASCLSMAVANIFLGLAAVATLHRWFRERPRFPRFFEIVGRPVVFLYLALFAAELLSMVGGLDPAAGWKRLGNHDIVWPSVMLATMVCVHERRQVVCLAELFVLSLVLNDLFALWQCAQAGGQMGRFSGGMFYMAYGTALLTALPLLLMYMIRGRDRVRRWMAAAAFLLSLAGLFLNGTRTVWVMVLPLCALAAFLCTRYKWKCVVGVLAGAAVFCELFSVSPSVHARVMSIVQMDADYSMQERQHFVWASAQRMFDDHPLTGIGYGSFSKAYHETYILPGAREPWLQHAHSNLMQELSECGILGITAFVALWLVFSVQAAYRWWKTGQDVYLVLLFSWNAIMLHGLTEYTWDRSITMKMFWMIYGLAYVWIARHSETCLRTFHDAKK